MITSSALKVSWLYFIGILAGGTIGITNLYLNEITNFFDLSPFLEGLAVSAITFVGAAIGYLIGFQVSKFPVHLVLSISLIFLAIAGFATTSTESPVYFLLYRFSAGFGFTVLVITIPAVMSVIPNDKARSFGLIMWGAYLPIGIAIGMLLPTLFGLDWVSSFNIHAVICLIASTVTFLKIRMPRHGLSERASIIDTLKDGNVLLLGLTFMVFATLFLIFVMLIPLTLSNMTKISASWLGIVSALICATSGITSISFAILNIPYKKYRRVVLVGFLGAGCTAPFIFLIQNQPYMLIIFLIIGVMLIALIPSCIFPSIPFVMSKNANAESISGAIAQLGGVGSLIGPPMLNVWIAELGWQTGWVMVISLCIIGALLFRTNN